MPYILVSVTSLKCWHCLPTGGGKLCNDGYGRSASCSSGDSVCIKGTTRKISHSTLSYKNMMILVTENTSKLIVLSYFSVINGENATVRSCLDGSRYIDGTCMKNSSELSGIPAADFCVCTNDLCNDANQFSTSNQIVSIFISMLLLMNFYLPAFNAI